ncbi:hypothetical protein [Micromonospora sp. WMMD1155]|uniref:hypothetical protein n=1 Tax=Micromonospora sp. WMMD1155 TaxID=3016094 RepID=UPI00249B9516|nr:hypothetical protein [Micromonospora sp. WMMD1155]WFE48824.1 hypothetical protein O7617_00150 [Micromonospora sp. WMMD1155]
MAFASVDPADGPRRDRGPTSPPVPAGPLAPAKRPLDVLVAHPEQSGRDVLYRLLDRCAGFTVVAVAGTEIAASDAVDRLRPAIVVIDDRMPNWALLARHARVVLLTGETDISRLGAILSGPASAYLTWNHFEPVDLLGAVRAVGDGLAWLCPVAASAAAAAMRGSELR